MYAILPVLPTKMSYRCPTLLFSFLSIINSVGAKVCWHSFYSANKINGFATTFFVQSHPFFAIQFTIPIIIQSNYFILNREIQQDSTCFVSDDSDWLTKFSWCALCVSKLVKSRRIAEVMQADSRNLSRRQSQNSNQIISNLRFFKINSWFIFL